MAEPQDPAELELVRKAITLAHITGCCEWDDRAARRLRAQPPLPALTPEGIKELLYEFACNAGGEVRQVPEKRPEQRHLPPVQKRFIETVVMVR